MVPPLCMIPERRSFCGWDDLVGNESFEAIVDQKRLVAALVAYSAAHFIAGFIPAESPPDVMMASPGIFVGNGHVDVSVAAQQK